MKRIIGLISGTSVDGIDAAFVEVSGRTLDLQVNLLAGETYPYPATLRSQILSVCEGAALTMAELAALDDAIAQEFAKAAIAIQAGHSPADLIGSHGQTVFHRPPQLSPSSPSSPLGYSLQLGRGALIAHLTGITTISNFRAADIALGGQGAPMVPPVDACLLSHPTRDRCIQNIGGIGNVTYLPATGVLEAIAPPPSDTIQPLPIQKILGWDTGPGNALLDLAVAHLSNGQLTFDQDGAWAAQGTPHLALVQQWLQHEFFQQLPPKSTGRELFGSTYLQARLAEAQAEGLEAADILATLTELTVAAIADNYRRFLPKLPEQVLVGGGGRRNRYLMQRLQVNLPEVQIYPTDEMGLNADFKEAIAFAVLAYWRSQKIAGNLPEVTGASQPTLLGEVNLVSKNW